MPKEADTVLLVEFLTDSRAANEASIAAVRRTILDELHLGFGAMDAYDPKEQERLWVVRKRAVQILQRLPGPTRITPFIEDVVVPPKELVAYIRGLGEIFTRFGVEAAVYGHAGDSNLHARPLLDLRRAEDVARMKGIADAVAHLTVDLGGTISCEHGDGLTRSGYLELQFGELYPVMAEVKRLWDPKGTLNPGKIVTDERQVHTDHLRMGPDFRLCGGRQPHRPRAVADRNMAMPRLRHLPRVLPGLQGHGRRGRHAAREGQPAVRGPGRRPRAGGHRGPQDAGHRRPLLQL